MSERWIGECGSGKILSLYRSAKKSFAVTGMREAPQKMVRSQRVGVELDSVDRSILRSLVDDARLPNSVLAQRAGVAPSTCLMRIRRLRESGVIKGLHAEPMPEAMGFPLQAMISVQLQPHARADIGTFTRRFSALPGVMNVFFLGGAIDFLLHVAAPNPEQLRNFVVRHLSASRDVATTQTSLIFEHATNHAGLLDLDDD